MLGDIVKFRCCLGNGLLTATAGVQTSFELFLYDQDSNPILSSAYDTIDSAYMSGTFNGVIALVDFSLVWISSNPPHYQVSYTPTVANEEYFTQGGLYSVLITVNGVTMSISDSPVVYANVEHDSLSEAVLIQPTANAGVEFSFDIQARDIYGNDRMDPNTAGTFTVTGTTAAGSPLVGRVAFKEFGVYQGFITSNLALEYMTIRVYYNGVQIGINGNFLVFVNPGYPSEFSTLESSSLVQGVAGLESSVTFTSIDRFGNIRVNSDDRASFVIQIQRTGGYSVSNLVIECVNGCPSATGRYVVRWTVNVASTYSITVVTISSLGGLPITNGNNRLVTVIPGITSQASATGAGVEGGIKGSFNVFDLSAMDQYGNYQLGHSDSFQVDVYFNVEQITRTNATIVPQSYDGMYSVSYWIESSQAGLDYSVMIYWINPNTSARVLFLNVPLEMIQSGDVSYARACTSLTDAQAISSCNNIVQVRAGVEQVFYIVNAGLDNLLIAPQSSRFSVYFFVSNSSTSLTTWASEVCACPLGPTNIPCEGGLRSTGSQCQATGTNGFWSVKFTPDRTGSFEVNIAERGVITTDQSPISFSGTYGTVDPLISTITNSQSSIVAGSSNSVLVTLKDRYGNILQENVSEGVYITVMDRSEPPQEVFSGQCTYISQSFQYSCTYSVNLIGSKTIFASWGAYSTGRFIQNTGGLDVVVVHAAVSPSACNVRVANDNYSVTAGKVLRLEIYARDQYTNPVLSDITWDTTILTSTPTVFTVISHVDDYWRLEAIPTETGTFLVRVYIASSPVGTSPPTVTITPATVSSVQSYITFSPSSVAGSPITFTLFLKDTYGNSWLDAQTVKGLGCYVGRDLNNFACDTRTKKYAEVASIGQGRYSFSYGGASTTFPNTRSAGYYEFTGLLAGSTTLNIASNVPQEVFAGPTDPTQTVLPSSLSDVVVDVMSSFLVYTRDQYQNVRTTASDDVIDAFFTIGASNCIADFSEETTGIFIGEVASTFVFEAFVPQNDGSYLVQFTATSTGVYNLGMQVNNFALDCLSTEGIVVTAGSGLASPVTSQVSIACSNPCVVSAGTPIELSLLLYDIHGNRILRALTTGDGDFGLDAGSHTVGQNGMNFDTQLQYATSSGTFSVSSRDAFVSMNYVIKITLLPTLIGEFNLAAVLIRSSQIYVLSAPIWKISITPGAPAGILTPVYPIFTAALPGYFEIQAIDVFGNNVSSTDIDYSIYFDRNNDADLSEYYLVAVDVSPISNGRHGLSFEAAWSGTYALIVEQATNHLEFPNIVFLHATCEQEFPGSPFRCPARDCQNSYDLCNDIISTCTTYTCFDGSCALTPSDCACPPVILSDKTI
jgi:hypothetical protein